METTRHATFARAILFFLAKASIKLASCCSAVTSIAVLEEEEDEMGICTLDIVTSALW